MTQLGTKYVHQNSLEIDLRLELPIKGTRLPRLLVDQKLVAEWGLYAIS